MDPPTKEEVKLLNELRERISDLDLGEEDKMDKNLVRFLRARSLDLNATESMIRNNVKWQAMEDVKGLLADYEHPSGWENEFYYGCTGFDRTGSAIIVAPFGKWDMQKQMALGNKEEFVKYVYHNMERVWTMLKKLSKGEDHMKQVVGLVDLEGFSLRQCTSIDVVEAAIRCLKAFEANYPETVKGAVVVNAPWAFQIIWKIVKPFLSERTHAKLDFIGSDKEKWREACLKLAEPSQFPEYYGGDLPDETKMHISRTGTLSTSENENDEKIDY